MILSSTLKRAAREPLLHFLFLGLLLFGGDRLLNARSDPKTIVLSADVQMEMRSIFVAVTQREPTPDDIKKLIDRWVENEVLYREGLALDLDLGDSSNRERMIFQARSIARSRLSLPPIDEPTLRAWFEARRGRYDTPTSYDFMEAVMFADNMPGALATFAGTLNRTSKSDTLGDLRAVSAAIAPWTAQPGRATPFKDRSRAHLVESHGSDFADKLAQLQVGEWQVLSSTGGLRVVRLEAMKPARAARFEDMKESVLQDLKDETMAQLTSDAVREMGKHYEVRIERATR